MRQAIFAILLAATSAAYASGCFLEDEYTSGMNKICVYQCVSGDRAITIPAVQLCPISL